MVVVVIEDHRTLRTSLGRLLRAAGHEPLLFESAEAYLDAPPPTVECLLIDLHLPGMSGLDLVRRLREEGSTVPTILTTADPSVAAEAERHGCAAFLLKPALATTLLSTLDSVAALPR